MKLNLGSHSKIVEGYTNVDALDLPNVDYICDITRTPWIFQPTSIPPIDKDLRIGYILDIADNKAEEILMVEVLEHISFRKTDAVLKEVHRVLKPGGKVHIQVPDCGEMMKAYCDKKIGTFMPHKPESVEQVKEIRERTGLIVHPNRWLFAFLGAQKHEYDAHLNIFTKERMEEYLNNAGFSKINFLIDPLWWKIKVDAFK